MHYSLDTFFHFFIFFGVNVVYLNILSMCFLNIFVTVYLQKHQVQYIQCARVGGFPGIRGKEGGKVHRPHSSSITPCSSSNTHALAPLAPCHSPTLRKSREGKWEQVRGFLCTEIHDQKQARDSHRDQDLPGLH